MQVKSGERGAEGSPTPQGFQWPFILVPGAPEPKCWWALVPLGQPFQQQGGGGAQAQGQSVGPQLGVEGGPGCSRGAISHEALRCGMPPTYSDLTCDSPASAHPPSSSPNSHKCLCSVELDADHCDNNGSNKVRWG